MRGEGYRSFWSMMDKHPDNDTLQAYLDGELSLDDTRDMEAHLRSCARCEAELAQLNRLFQAIESVPSEPLKTDLAPEVVNDLRPRLPTLAIGEFLLAAALTLVLVLGLGGSELQIRVGDAAQRLIGELESAGSSISQVFDGLVVPLPDTPQWDLAQIGDLVGSALVSPGLLWGVIAAALVLWLLGNGLVLRLGKDNNA